jgi:type 1 fimbria pilin
MFSFSTSFHRRRAATSATPTAVETPLTDSSQHGGRRWRLAFGTVAVLGLVLGLMPGQSRAASCWTQNTPRTNPTVYTLSYSQPINVNPSLAVGSILGSINNVTASALGQAYITCDFAFNTQYWRGATPGGGNNYTVLNVPSLGAVAVYDTAVAGVGIALKTSFGTSIGGSSGGFFPSQYINLYPANEPQPLQTWVVFDIYLIKTGPITAGGNLTGEVGQFWVVNNAGYEFKWISITFGASVPVVPTVPSCTVSTPNPYTVTLQSANVQAFPNVGDTTGDTDFNLTLSCTGGSASSSTNAWMTMTDATDTSNRTNTLTPAVGSTTQGVGLQVLYGNSSTPISFGPDSSARGTQNQFFLQNVAQGVSQVTLPFKVRYIRTGTMQPGDLKGIATFTMSYQ